MHYDIGTKSAGAVIISTIQDLNSDKFHIEFRYILNNVRDMMKNFDVGNRVLFWKGGVLWIEQTRFNPKADEAMK